MPRSGRLAASSPINLGQQGKLDDREFRIGEYSPDHFISVEREGLRKLVNAYAKDIANTYTFDEDHAMLAFPIRVLSSVARAFRARGREPLTEPAEAFLRQKCRDSTGTIVLLVELFCNG